MPQRCEWGKLEGKADVASLRGRIIEKGVELEWGFIGVLCIFRPWLG